MTEVKPKVAFYWMGTCGGCEESVVDLAERILDVVAAVDIIFWPVALDFKKADVEAMEDGSIAVALINGCVRNSEDEKMGKLLRKKAGLIVAYGACAQLGGIPGLANFHTREEIFQKVYIEAPTINNPEKIIPQLETEVNGLKLTLPTIYNTVKKLDDIIDVDYYIPGCAPHPDLLMGAIQAILSGNLPPNGSILSPNRNMCDTCPLERKENKIIMKEFKRIHQIIPEEGQCLLEQGVMCLGPVTRNGCDAACMKVGMPCRGCYGPTDEVEDMGTKYASALASIWEETEEEDVIRMVKSIPSFAKMVYYFSTPSSILKRKKMEVIPK
jgi:F420-non-reducing hydrogenase small subunit